MISVLSRFLPIFAILILGSVLKQKKILDNHIVDGLKKIIVNVALPSILFLSFLTMNINLGALYLFIATFVFCLLLYSVGILFQKTGLCNYSLSQFFFTGFEFGMVGVALFSSIFGSDQLYNILLIGLGHEFFIWFFYAPLLESQNTGSINIKEIIQSFFKSPIIIAILTALLLNLSGLYITLADNEISNGIVTTISMLSKLVTPLILITIGSNLKFKDIPWKSAIHLISFRFISVSILGIGLFAFTKYYIMDISKIMAYAFVIFFLLPPPFIIPVFLGNKYEKEGIFYNNLLILSTLVTLILFMIIMFIFGI